MKTIKENAIAKQRDYCSTIAEDGYRGSLDYFLVNIVSLYIRIES